MVIPQSTSELPETASSDRYCRRGRFCYSIDQTRCWGHWSWSYPFPCTDSQPPGLERGNVTVTLCCNPIRRLNLKKILTNVRIFSKRACRAPCISSNRVLVPTVGYYYRSDLGTPKQTGVCATGKKKHKTICCNSRSATTEPPCGTVPQSYYSRSSVFMFMMSSTHRPP